MTSRSGPAAPAPARLHPGDLAGLASVGLRTRKLRASLSALGIAIGVASIVAVLGLARSSQAGLLAEIGHLGTNLLTVSNGQDLTGQTAELPDAAPGMVGRLPAVTAVQYTGTVGAAAYRSPLVPPIDTDGLSVDAASLGLPAVAGTSVAQGRYLNAATASEPVAVLGAEAAQLMGIDRIWPGERIWVGGQWFYLAGILNPATLAPQLDNSVLVGFPAAHTYLGFDGHPSDLYIRTVNTQAATTRVDNLLAAQANPEHPDEVNVSQPSDALTAQADAAGAFDTLFLGLGAVALLVGAVGVANIMIISVLERRQEIGLRRALGATKGQIRTQFLAEAILLALAGGAAGDVAGAVATACYAHARGWVIVVPPEAWAGGLGAALLIGALAGLLPAIRAARLSPTQALWTL
jgi:putative ABC transport system permease protein